MTNVEQREVICKLIDLLSKEVEFLAESNFEGKALHMASVTNQILDCLLHLEDLPAKPFAKAV